MYVKKLHWCKKHEIPDREIAAIRLAEWITTDVGLKWTDVITHGTR